MKFEYFEEKYFMRYSSEYTNLQSSLVSIPQKSPASVISKQAFFDGFPGFIDDFGVFDGKCRVGNDAQQGGVGFLEKIK